MKQFLLKTLEILRRLVGLVLELARRIFQFLRSVEIDQPRGALLAVAFQFLLVAAAVVGLRAADAIKPQRMTPGQRLLEPPVVIESETDTDSSSPTATPDANP